MKTATARILGLAILVAATTLAPARAQPGVTLEGQTNFNEGDYTLGYEFEATASESVTALGVYDASGTGNLESHDVGLWNSAGALLASTTVAAGTTDPLVDQFRFTSITPVELTVGSTYTVGAVYVDGSDAWAYEGSVNPASGLDFLQDGFSPGFVLTDPTQDGNVNGYFGGNVFLGAPVPELSSTAVTTPLAFTLLLFGLLDARRKLSA